MKRFGVHFFVAVLFAAIGSGFILPQKTFAAVDKTAYDAAVNSLYNTNVEPFTNGRAGLVDMPLLGDVYIPGVQTFTSLDPLQKSTLRDRLYAAAEDIYKNYGSKESMTMVNLRPLLLDRWLSELEYLKNTTTWLSNAGTALNLITISLTQAKESAQAFQQQDAGKITNAEAMERVGAAAAKAQAATFKPGGCSLVNGNFITCVDQLFAWLIKHTFLRFANFLLFITASLLNYSIQLSIFDFSKWAPESLYPIWTVIRQIVSLFVVFAGLYLGFLYIVGREDTFGKYIGWLVLFALFVNFSYPLSRALVDVSNVVSLNVYTAALGPETLNGNGGAGDIIRDKLNIQTLINGIGQAEGGDDKGIANAPGSLLAVAFLLYAAYIFFMATAIIAIRAAVLVFLIVASPLLLIDSVVPRLGEAAVKMRKIFFEQLVVAPVFMIMLALTLKFMDVFHTAAGARTDSVAVFFNILIMLVMLHIMLKVTKEVGGSVGKFATEWAGKAGGFGLGAASMGTGMLARGSIGALAARARDAGWMDKLQGSRTGRGLYSLTNSLAQSSFDTRNIGVLNRGMSSLGMGMGKGSTQTYDKRFAEKETAFNRKLRTIKDGEARQGYIDQTRNGVRSVIGRELLFGKSDGDLITKRALEARKKIVDRYNSITDPGQKKAFYHKYQSEIDAFNHDEATSKSKAAILSTPMPEGVVPAPDTVVDKDKLPTAPTTTAETDWKSRDTPAYLRKEEAEKVAKQQAEAKKKEEEDVDTSYVDMAEGRAPKQSTPTATESSAPQGQGEGRAMTETEVANMQKKFNMSAMTLAEAMRQRKPPSSAAGTASGGTPSPQTPPQKQEAKQAVPA